MRSILETTTKYILKSPSGALVAKYDGTEYGMGSPTLGNFLISTGQGKNLYSFPGFAQANFSDNSKYFIYKRPYGSGSSLTYQVTVIELATGKDVWITEYRNGKFSEAIAPGTSFQVNKIDIKSLNDEDLVFDISLCEFIE